MCGLAGFFARESVPSFDVLDMLFSWAEKRGTDGFGYVVVQRSNNRNIDYFKSIFSYSSMRDAIYASFKSTPMHVGDLLLAICRAAPEQEPPSSLINMQPIFSNGCILVHNGSVSQKIYDEIKQNVLVSCNDFEYTTEIDSEAIIASYIHHGRNIKEAMEYISGGVAAMMYDTLQDRLYLVTDFKPLAQCYIRGVGYFLASDNDCLGEIVQSITACPRDGMCLWEDWYHHYISGGKIKSIDLDSGFVRNISYSPRFMTQNWDSNFEKGVDFHV